MPIAPKKINHHYVSKMYLRNFCFDEKRKQVYCTDFYNKKIFPVNIRNIGSKRNFNRFSLNEDNPNVLEDIMSSIEGVVSPFLEEIIYAKCFPSFEHFESSMLFFARMASANLSDRILTKGFCEEIGRLARIGEYVIEGNPNGKACGTSYPWVLNSETGEYDIAQDYLIGIELEILEGILPLFMERKWIFIEAPEGAEFVTSNRPIRLVWYDGRMNRETPTHSDEESDIYIPLSPRLTLHGVFTRRVERNLVAASDRCVSLMNAVAAEHSGSQIYSLSNRYKIYKNDGALWFGSDLFV